MGSSFVPCPRPTTVVLRLGLLDALIAFAILGRCLREVHWLGPATAAFVGATWIEYSALYLLPALVPAILLARAANRFPPLRFVAYAWLAVVATAIHVVLAADTVVFHLYGFHVNGFVWNLLRTPGGIASMDTTGSTQLTFALLVVGAVAVQGLAVALAVRQAGWSRVAPARPRRLVASVALTLLVLGTGERAAFAVSNLIDYEPIVSAYDTFPFYGRTRMRKLAALLGLEQRREAHVKFESQGINLVYPLVPLRMAEQRPRWNVVWLVAESWRGDQVADPVVMPRMNAFAQDALWFRNHFSGGNGTRTGVFSMFYGLYGSYWSRFLFETRGPVLIDRLLADDYQFFVSTSAKFSFPEFDKTVWSRLPRSQLTEGAESQRGWQNDRALVGKMLDAIDARDRDRPFFAFHFFESPHAQYWFPDESIVARPFCAELNYATLERDDMPLVKNRYLNAVHHLDGQLARVVDGLAERGLLDSTIVVLTGDHGEEFMEKGRYGHHSDFSDEQIKPPLIVRVPGVAARQITTVSSHLDLPATVLSRLGILNPPGDYSLGLDLLSGAHHEYVVIADWDHLCIRDDRFKGIFPVDQKGFFGFEVTTADDVPVRDYAAYRRAEMDELVAVMKGQSRFLR